MTSPAQNSPNNVKVEYEPPVEGYEQPPPRRFGNNKFKRGRGGGPSFGPRFPNRQPFNRRNDDTEQDSNKEARFQDKLFEKLGAIAGPTCDLPFLDTSIEKKFSGRSRLYIGNLAPDVSEEELTQLLGKYGETSELFVNKEKNFAFVKMDFCANAEKAKRELDGTLLKGKNLKIRFAPSNASIKVKNLPSFVSNELLLHAFQVFGEVERALILVDERGKPTGEGIVEFVRKGCALSAIRNCTERCFFLTDALQPVVVEMYEHINDTDGYQEKFLPKRNPDFVKARSKGPRLADLNSFEHEYGVRWKQLLELYAQKEQALKKELLMEKEKLGAQMEYARYEHETEMLREQLRAREQDRERQKQEWEMKERQVEEQRRRNEEQMRRQQESMQNRMMHQEEDMRRRQQENNLFMQAHQLHNMLDEQEQAFQGPPMDNFEQQNSNNDENMGPRGGFRRDRWVTERRDDFGPKRRRF